MSIVDDAVAKILAMLPAQELSVGLEDDAGLSFPPHLIEQVYEMWPSASQVAEEGEDILGEYRPMASPGRITLYWDRIGCLFWRTVFDLRQSGILIERRDLKRLATVAVQKTYTHERFHYFCDVARHLFGAPPDSMKEEALAVAWSFNAIEGMRDQWNSSAGLLGEGAYRAFISRIYRYTAPGYRDWVNYQTRPSLHAGIVEHLVPAPKRHFFQSSGVDLAPVLLAARDALRTGGAVEVLRP